MESREVRPELALENQLCFALYDASRAVVRAYGSVLSGLGLTYPQYLVMLVLWEADEPVPVGRLAAALHLENNTITPLLKRLVQQGLVTRTRDPGDDRRVLIELSPAGWELRERVPDIPGQVFGGCGLDLDGAVALRETLASLARAVEPVSS